MYSSKRSVQNLCWLSAFVLMNLFLSCYVNAQSANDDIVYLKNGTMIRGTIFEQVPKSYIKIKTLEGKVQKYKFNEISKIVKAEQSKVEEKPPVEEKPVAPLPVEKKSIVIREQPKPVQNTTMANVKSPTTAFLLSLVLPGGGQYYNGQYTKGAIMTGTAVAGVVLILAAGYEDIFVYSPDYYWASYGYWTTESTTWLTVGTVLVVGSSIWSMIDAPITANKINERNNATMGHMFEIGTEQYIVGCDLVPTKQGLRLSTTLHF
jgi:TM2 domain-containing membrane protein YozV